MVKILFFGLLIVSFGLWGITDYLNPNTNRDNVVATIDGKDISLDQFKPYYENQKQQLQMGQFGPEMAKNINLAQLVMDQYIARAVVEKRVHELKLTPDNKILAQLIKKDKAFSNSDGTFSAEKFRQLLTMNNLTEAQLLKSVGDQVTQGWLYESATPQFFTAPNLAKLLNDSRFTQYAMEYGVIKAKNLPTPAKPTPDDLKQFYQKHAEQYRTPQYRSGGMVRISVADISKKLIITPADVEKYYNDNPDQFNRPRTISFDQLLFDDEAQAKQASDKAQKTALDKLGMGKYTKLEKITADQAQFAELGDEFTKLKKGEISTPKKTNFGWVMIKIKDIDEGGKNSLASVKGDIENRLKTERAIDELNQIAKKLEKNGDIQGQELADQYGVKYQLIPLTDRTGKTTDGKQYEGFKDEIFNILYQLKAGASDILNERDAVVVLRVNEIKESAIPTQEMIADKVASDWLAQKYVDILEEKSKLWANEVANGAKLEKIIKDNGGQYKTIAKIQYQDVLQEKTKIEGINPHFAFKTMKNKDNKAVYTQFIIQGDSAIITNLTPLNEKPADNSIYLQNVMAKAVSQEFQQGYIDALKKHFKVVVKPNVLERVY